MARNSVKFTNTNLMPLIRELDRLGGDVESTLRSVLAEAQHEVAIDTARAVSKSYLPAGGKYSTGDTEKAIVDSGQVYIAGGEAWVPLGFDFAKKGAGGFLIAGTPKDAVELQKIYKNPAYMRKLQKTIADKLMEHIADSL